MKNTKVLLGLTFLLIITVSVVGCNRSTTHENTPLKVYISTISTEKKENNKSTVTFILEIRGNNWRTLGTGHIGGYFKKINNNIIIDLPNREAPFNVISEAEYTDYKDASFILIENAQVAEVEQDINHPLIDELAVIYSQDKTKPGVLLIVKGRDGKKLKVLESTYKEVDNNLEIAKVTIGLL